MDAFDRNSPDTIDHDETVSVALDSTPSSLLPAELLLDIFSLCQASSHLPITCCACSSDFFKPGEKPHRIWSHRHVFLDQQYDHETAHEHEEYSTLIYGSQEVNESYTRVAQIESRVAYYLKARAPVAEGDVEEDTWAAGIAPPVSDLGSTKPAIVSVISGGFVDWLFCQSGPFAHRNGVRQMDVIAQLKQKRGKAESDDESEDCLLEHVVDADDIDSDLARAGKPSPSRRFNWRILPDALLLVHFFIRTTQLDLLESTLLHLRSALPTLATTSAPLSIWAHYMIDNRPHLRNLLRTLVINTSNAPISYPTFLCFLALVDWSKPALDVVARMFSDSIDLPTTVNTISSNSDMVQCMAATLHLLTCPPSTSNRVLVILNLFQQCNAPMMYEQVPVLSHHITGSYAIFADVFRFYDMPNLPRMAGNPVRHILGTVISKWVCKGNVGLLNIALEHDLFEQEDMGRVLNYAASQRDMDLVDRLAQRDLLHVVGHALDHAASNESTFPDAFPILFNLLITHTHLRDNLPNPTDVLFSLSRHWTPNMLSVALFDSPRRGLRFPWDYPRYLRAQLEWAMSRAASRSITSRYAIGLGRLIDQCTADGFEWELLEFECLALSCSIRLIALYKSMQPEEARAARRLDPNERAAIARLSKVLVARMREAAKVQGEDQGAEIATFTLCIPRGHSEMLHDAVTRAASLPPPAAHPHETKQIDSALSVFLDTLIDLDHEFVLDSIPWTQLGSVRHWHRFTPAEIASRIDSKCALALVRSAIADSGDTDNVDTLAGLIKAFPSEIREAEEFVRGLCAGMNRRHMFRSKISDGIWKAGWKDWPAQMARFALSLDDGAEEDDSNCEGHEFSPSFG